MTEIDGDLSALQRAMNSLSGAGLLKFKSRVTYYVAVAIKGVIKPYKPQHPGKVIWPSEKARRYYFAMRRERGLPMEYKRGSDPMSQRVSQSWTIARGSDSATLGNRATYAPYVASSEYQTAQHERTGFTTDEQAADQVMQSGVMDKIIQAHIKGMMDEAFRGLR